MATDRLVLTVSRRDPAAGTVSGHHVELIDGAPVRLRPWQLGYLSPEALDAEAAANGLILDHRSADLGRGTLRRHELVPRQLVPTRRPVTSTSGSGPRVLVSSRCRGHDQRRGEIFEGESQAQTASNQASTGGR